VAEALYLDHAASTPLDPRVRAVLLAALEDAGRARVAAARARLAGLLGVTPEAVTLTSGGTEACNAGVLGTARAARSRGRHVVSQPTEHPAVLRALERLAGEGYEVTHLPVDGEGRVQPDDLARALRPDTVLCAVMRANNETGVLQPTRALGAVARAAGVTLFVDAVQAARWEDASPAALGADLVALSAHKLDGPKGVGALVGGRAPGPPPRGVGPHLAAAFAEALALRAARRGGDAPAVASSRDALERAILRAVPGALPNGAGGPRLPGHLNASLPGVSGEAVAVELDRGGISASSGSACSTGAPGPSHVLLASGRSRAEAAGSVRLTLARPLDADERRRVVSAIAAAVERLGRLAGARPSSDRGGPLSYRRG